MDSKSFKEMIKKHQVKQSFVRLDPELGQESVYRFYQDTSDPEKLYCHIWYIDKATGDLQKEVEQINKGIWQFNWHKYTSDCLYASTYELNRKLFYFQSMLTKAPMHQRKYWKIKVDTVLFMMKDKRINRSES